MESASGYIIEQYVCVYIYNVKRIFKFSQSWPNSIFIQITGVGMWPGLRASQSAMINLLPV